jgi:hypothetical protein
MTQHVTASRQSEGGTPRTVNFNNIHLLHLELCISLPAALSNPNSRHELRRRRELSESCTMPWLFWSKPAPTTSTSSSSPSKDDGCFTPAAAAELGPGAAPPPTPRRSASSSSSSKPISWNESLNATDWAHYAEPRNWVPTLLVTATALGALQFYRSYLRRIPGTAHIAPGLFRRRTLLGRVTSVGDGDNFHLFHTPGGRLAGWGWLRRVPSVRAELKGRTVSDPAVSLLIYNVTKWERNS